MQRLPSRAFGVIGQMDDEALAERLDAFVARFARVQDTAGDKLLPVLLQRVGEPVGSALDNLDRAPGWACWLSTAKPGWPRVAFATAWCITTSEMRPCWRKRSTPHMPPSRCSRDSSRPALCMPESANRWVEADGTTGNLSGGIPIKVVSSGQVAVEVLQGVTQTRNAP